ncbi:MAG: nucleotide-binding protein [Methanoregula sp.]|nr:nucleotide-binding protein [Methanoregula sp.]
MILLDANALMMPVQFKIDLFSDLQELVGGFEPVVLPGVVKELTGLARAKGRDGAAARYGLSLAQKCTVAVDSDVKSGTVDEQLIDYAMRHNCLVVTNDRLVKDRVLDRGIGVIIMRNQKKLDIVRK